MNRRVFTLLVLLSLVPAITACGEKPAPAEPETSATSSTSAAQPGYYSRDELIQDARQLADILESTHPDPYIRGGGKIAFHRRLHQLLNAIPEEGMTKNEFVRLLRPFIAAVGDGHTNIWDAYVVNSRAPGGVPLLFHIVEESLYVAGVPDEEDSDLLGALLVSVEGVPLAELCERQKRVRGSENKYYVLQVLAVESLWYRPFMEDVLPEWEDASRASVELQLPSGEIRQIEFELPVRLSMSSLHTPRTQVVLPKYGGFHYHFFDAEENTAYLRVEDMMYYREAYEIWALAGSRPSTEETRAQAPSAAETYTPAAGGGEIRRYSRLYFESCENLSIEDFNEGRAVPLVEGGYCFDDDFTNDDGKVRYLFQESEMPAFLDRWINRSSTFHSEFQSGAYAGYYRPQRILVLVNPRTFSSGFTMARKLYLAGATLVGTPSGQASNCFGEMISWQLQHSKIKGGVSVSYYNQFPNDPELGRVLPVHHPLTYEKLASYDFAPNAEYLYALELLAEHGE